MRLLKSWIFLFLINIAVLTENAHAISFREGQRGSVARVVLDVPEGMMLGLSENITSTHIRIDIEGDACGRLAGERVSDSQFLKEIEVEQMPPNPDDPKAAKQCTVKIFLTDPRVLQKAELKAPVKGKSGARLILDLRRVVVPQNSQPADRRKKPLRPINGSIEVFLVDPDHQVSKTLQGKAQKAEGAKSPQPTQEESTLQNGAGFQPLLLEKPHLPVIVLDPGHGGHDPGSVSCKGAYEKNVTLKAASLLAHEIKKTGRYHVVLTRADDSFVPKRQRFAVAREAQADFFISIHADSHPTKTLRGLTIYTLSATASDKEAERLSKQENKSELVDGLKVEASDESDVSNVLLDIAQTSSSNTAQLLAEQLHCTLTSCDIGKVMSLRSADLAVLKAPETPSILVELGYLSNEKDEKLIQSTAYQKKLAESLIHALDKYFEKAY